MTSRDNLGQPIGSKVRLTDKIGIGVLTGIVGRDLIDEVLLETAKREKRSRLLPARVVVYYVMALTLFFGESYEEVMRRLVGGLQHLRAWSKEWHVPSGSAISQARKRLGEAPMKELFQRVAQPIAKKGSLGAWYQGRRVMAIDGVVLDVADTSENHAAFGRSGNRIADSPFPQIRVVALAECGTRACVAATIGTMKTHERQATAEILSAVEPNMLVLADRGYYSYDLWKTVRTTTGADLLWRLMSQIDLPVYESLPDGSYLTALLPKSMRSDMKRGKYRRIDRFEIPVRIIEYRIPDRSDEVIRLATSILDPEEAPAIELAALYHERWEIEMLFDEIETHQIGAQPILRSRSPELVRQEVWGLLLTHYAIRHLMAQTSEREDVDIDRLSFMRSLRVIRRQVTDQSSFSPQKTRYRTDRHLQRDS